MGFLSTATTLSLTARLTPIGRAKLAAGIPNVISTFAIGDSDANYNESLVLSTGQIPGLGGTIGANSTISNSVADNVAIKSYLLYNSKGATTKSVELHSSEVTSQILLNTQTTLSGTNITQNLINRNNTSSDALVNLYYSFGLPLNTTNDIKFTGATFSSGGYSNTAISGVSTTNILVIGLNNSSVGELIDGKQVKVNLTTSASSYILYSTFQNTGLSTSIQDANYRDVSTNLTQFGSNVALLFSDSIMKPNGGDSTLSWATGFATNKPFSVNSKRLFNLMTNTNLGQTADTAVGIVYLDKGFAVITHPTIVNSFSPTSTGGTATTVTFNSVSIEVAMNITCILDKNQFSTSTNSTYTKGDTVRISEVGLYDDESNLIAYAKTDRHITKTPAQFIALGLKITI